MKKSEIIFGIIRIPVDFFMSITAFVSGYYLRQNFKLFDKAVDPDTYQPLAEYLVSSSIASTVLIILFALNGLYIIKNRQHISREIRKVFHLSLILLLFIISYFFFIHDFPFSRAVYIYSCALTAITVSIGRILVHNLQNKLLTKGIGQRKVLFIGNNVLSSDLANAFLKTKQNQVIGVVDHKNHQKSHKPLKYLGGITDIPKLIKKHQIEEIIQTNDKKIAINDLDIIDFCQTHHINYRFIPNTLVLQRTNIDISTIHGIPIISLKTTPLDGWHRVLKRSFDITGASIGLLLFSPLFLIIAAAIKIDSKGPILFCRKDDGTPVKRIGQYGKPFRFYKFRTMRHKTDNLRYTKLAKNDIRKNSPLVKIKNDPRITKVGRFLRRTSFDELPQFWSVLTGKLSLVGPRPHLPEEVAKYKKHQHFVFNIKPGITGLAQISGRSDLEFNEEIRLDRYYIENWTIWMDIKILIKTLAVPFRGYEE